MIAFSRTVSVGAVVRTRTASAQCGPIGPETLANTTCGDNALVHNNTGALNSGFGSFALFANTAGFENTADGAPALDSNRGNQNTASGRAALYSNITGSENTANGEEALVNNTTGSMNIGIGYNAASNIVVGSDNIEIGGAGTADESKTIRIGTQGAQTTTFIAGIEGTGVTHGDAVEVSSTGQLGVHPSSARYKRDIHDMGSASSGLMKLRPVTFRYKNDSTGTLQYGLVAEEVARVYSELVTRGTDGKLQTVHYLDLTGMLLNELQKQARETRQLAERLEMKDQQLAVEQRDIDALKQQNASINALSERLAALEQQARTAHAQLAHVASK